MRFVSIVLLTMAVATPVFASRGDKPEPTQTPPGSSLPSDVQAPASGPRREAEQSYALAYDEIAKAKKDLEAGKAKPAEKKFRKAMERVEKATALDAGYHEAWNLLGYCARKLGDYDKAFSAYQKCLSINPDYAPAHEYLGEAYLEKDQPARAREQLALLERSGEAEEEAGRLFTAIQAYEKAHPSPAVPASEAAADSTSGSSR